MVCLKRWDEARLCNALRARLRSMTSLLGTPAQTLPSVLRAQNEHPMNVQADSLGSNRNIKMSLFPPKMKKIRLYKYLT